MIWPWRRPGPAAEAALRLYDAVVAQARRPELYARLGIPDTVDGRFDSLVLHLFLVLHRLKAEPDGRGRELAQALSDRLIDDMDRNLREMGAGDLGVGRRVRQMAEGFAGRVHAYDSALADEAPEALGMALARNVYGTLPAPAAAPLLAALEGYVRAAVAALAAQDSAVVLAGRADFPDPPAMPGA